MDTNSITVRSTIVSHMAQVASERNKKLVPLSDDLALLECGFDSLDFAILVARLEDALGIDPFTTSDDVYYPVTVGDFVRFYENAKR